jgi:hypothetical protein
MRFDSVRSALPLGSILMSFRQRSCWFSPGFSRATVFSDLFLPPFLLGVLTDGPNQLRRTKVEITR